MRLLLYLLPTITLVVYGQLVVKWRVAHLGARMLEAQDMPARLMVYLSDPLILSAYVAVFASSVTWMFVIEKYPLSLAFPIHIGLTVFAVLLGGMLLFGEEVTAQRVVAILLILAGVAIGSRT
jgi:multidrug transporter EmrE-like cation transporter